MSELEKKKNELKKEGLGEKLKGAISYYKDNIKTDKRLLFGTIGVIVAAVLIIVVLLLLLLVNPSKSVVLKYAQAMVDYDAREIVDITHEDMIDYFEEQYGEDYKDLLKDNFDRLKDANYKYREFEIDSDYKKYDKDDVEDFAEEWDDLYDLDEKSVKDVRRYTVKFKISDDGDRSTLKEKILVAKIDGKWYYMGVDE